MRAAQIIRLSERQPIGRARRAPEKQSAVILQLFRAPVHGAAAPHTVAPDEDRVAGRSRDPG